MDDLSSKPKAPIQTIATTEAGAGVPWGEGRPLKLPLRPIWPGFLITSAGFLVTMFYVISGGGDPRSIAILCNLTAFVYYFMLVHRIVKVLEEQPGWSVEYTPAAAVWKHFIPFYGLYFLYRWPGDVESYIAWRTGRESRVGLWTFLGLLAGFLIERFVDPLVGLTIAMLSLYMLYVPLQRALALLPPDAVAPPGYNPTLGLGLR